MKRAMIVLLGILVSGALAGGGFAKTSILTQRLGPVVQPPEVDDTGGPDEFGYIWIDSDEPNGPEVDFIDISAYGTEVEGLGDDNFVGPFPIGFDFRFYWYDVDQYWVGSNGWVKFSTGGQLAQPMPHIPVATPPNDLLCPFAADLFFELTGGQGTAYYWSNNVDSCIIAYHNVPTWEQGAPHGTGSHTFEIILTAADSNITFQYDAQQGAVSNNSCVVGIENNTGMIGLEVMYTPNQPPAYYAVLFDYPDSITYEVHDMAVASVMNEGSTGMFALVDEDLDIVCTVRNAGNRAESSFQVTAEVVNMAGQVQWDGFYNVTTMEPGEELEITFPIAWTPDVTATYRVDVEVDLTGDMNPDNDYYNCELNVVDLPDQLAYDDGSSEYQWGWAGGEGGMGVRFVPPTYPCQITEVSFYFEGTPMVEHELQIVDDDGGYGHPGTVLFSYIFAPTTAYIWIDQTISPPVIIDDGAFFLGLIQSAESMSFSMDTTSHLDPQSRQTWEYTGVWAPFRNEATYEFMMRCDVDFYSDVEPGELPVVTYSLLENYPNPFNPSTTIVYSLPTPGNVVLKVFDVNGRLVNTLVNGQIAEGVHRVGWSGTDLSGKPVSTGIYFYSINTPEGTKTAKMVLIK